MHLSWPATSCVGVWWSAGAASLPGVFLGAVSGFRPWPLASGNGACRAATKPLDQSCTAGKHWPTGQLDNEVQIPTVNRPDGTRLKVKGRSGLCTLKEAAGVCMYVSRVHAGQVVQRAIFREHKGI